MKLQLCVISVVVLSLICCRENKRILDAKQIVKEWTGKTVTFPDIEPFYPFGADSIPETYLQAKDYKILFYVDSAGCTQCRLRLQTWKMYIEELGDKVNFLFYFHPKIRKKKISTKELISAVNFSHFNYPVYIDEKNELKKMNNLPDNSLYQCFLLDRNNKVLAIGNPAEKLKIWEFYKKTITGKPSERQPLTTVEAEQNEIEIKNLQVGKTSEAVFRLKNTGNVPLAIIMVESSCGCTVPEWEKQPVTVGQITEIKVKITPEEQKYFRKSIIVHCNTESGRIDLYIKGSVDK